MLDYEHTMQVGQARYQDVLAIPQHARDAFRSVPGENSRVMYRRAA